MSTGRSRHSPITSKACVERAGKGKGRYADDHTRRTKPRRDVGRPRRELEGSRRTERDRSAARHRRRRAATAAGGTVARLRNRADQRRARHVRVRTGGVPLQPLGDRARRNPDDGARQCDGMRGSEPAARRADVHHARAQSELPTTGSRHNRPRPRRGKARAPGWTRRHRRGPSRRRKRLAVRPRHEHVPHLFTGPQRGRIHVMAAVEQPSVAPRGLPDDAVELIDGSRVTIRLIHAADAYALLRMFDRLSPESIYHRFFSPMPQPRRAALLHLTGLDNQLHEAMVAEVDAEIVGIARYDGRADEDDAAVAVIVADGWHGP